MDGADLYLKAMLEAAEAGERVDWNGVGKVIAEAAECDSASHSVSRPDDNEACGYFDGGFYAGNY